MAQVFHPSTNTIAKATIFGALFVIGAVSWIGAEITRSPYVTRVNLAREQPVPFSHEHHVAGIGIDCRYCHTSVENSSFAGIPSTKTCMTCHSQIWTNAELLEPVRQSWKTGQPILWTRVHDLGDYVYFNHGIHVQKGVACVTCHGRVDTMPLTWKTGSLLMEWCLDCHRQPEKFIRPREAAFKMDWAWPDDKSALEEGQKLVEKYQVKKDQLTNCSVCHH
jgi:hypothetical protein